MRILSLFGLLLLGSSQLALADNPGSLDLRVGRLEKEMHAVQRKVFPGGAPVEPEITAAPTQQAGAGASSPLVDLGQRVDLLEAQVKTLTGETEQNTIKLHRLEDALHAQDVRLKALEPATAAPVAPATATASGSASGATPALSAGGKSAKSVKPTIPPKPVVDTARAAKLAAIEVPNSGDQVEDAYTYAYRLYQAQFYAEAEAKLKDFTTKYPHSKRYSYAQNLLGRAYYDDGKYGSAASALVENYDKMPTGDRAAESLSWAGSALIKYGAPAKACRVFEAFDGVYGAKASADAQARVAKGRIDAKCKS